MSEGMSFNVTESRLLTSKPPLKLVSEERHFSYVQAVDISLRDGATTLLLGNKDPKPRTPPSGSHYNLNAHALIGGVNEDLIQWVRNTMDATHKIRTKWMTPRSSPLKFSYVAKQTLVKMSAREPGKRIFAERYINWKRSHCTSHQSIV